jgi:putative SOS response-associated peptidase YedK
MCGRLWQTMALNFLVKEANTKNVRNHTKYNGTYNMGPTNYIPAIRRNNNLLKDLVKAT